MRTEENVYFEFLTQGELKSIHPYGNGHINDTYIALSQDSCKEHKYILQKLNTSVFKSPDILMHNFVSVTSHLKKKIEETGGDPERECLICLKTKSGEDFYVSPEGEYWRLLLFVSDSKCYERVENPRQFYESAIAFGNFQRLLSDYPMNELKETIKNFHNTRDRYRLFSEAVDKDCCGRLNNCLAEVDFVKKREEFCSLFENEHEAGRLPLRVTHNDTKLNNILFDEKTDKPICVIDLDTVMPGYAVNDFGDSIRFGANTADEDERDLSLVEFDMSLFEIYTKGFIQGAHGALLKSEIELLPYSAIMMTLECGMRFLTDYLSGDTYFKIHRDGHNLDRARVHFKLVSEMEKNLDKMKDIVNKYFQ